MVAINVQEGSTTDSTKITLMPLVRNTDSVAIGLCTC